MAIVAELTGTNSAPLYTFNFSSDVSNHNCPLTGRIGRPVSAKFSNNFIKFSLSASPNPLKFLPINDKSVDNVSNWPSATVATIVPSVLLS